MLVSKFTRAAGPSVIKKFLVACAGAALTATAASAADLPSRRAPPVYVPPVVAVPYSWSGLEFGLTTSYSFSGTKNVTTTPFGGTFGAPGFASLNKSGFDTVGGGVAYNYQFHPGSGVVIGGAADVNYFNLTKFAYGVNNGGTGGNYEQRVAYIGTANGRLGYAFDRVLVYGVGGFAYGEVHDAAYLFSGNSTSAYYGTSGNISKGYDYGGGIEYAIPADSFLNYLSVDKLLGKVMGGNKFTALSFLDALSSTLRVEFVHYDLGTRTVVSTSTVGNPGGFVNRFRTEGNVLRFGLGYKFDGSAPAPVVARY